MIFVYCVCKVRYSCELIHIDLAKLSSLCAGQLQHLIALLGEKIWAHLGTALPIMFFHDWYYTALPFFVCLDLLVDIIYNFSTAICLCFVDAGKLLHGFAVLFGLFRHTS